MHGSPCPRACRSPTSCPSRCSRRRPRPTIGDHDENIDFAAAVDLVGKDVAEKARDISLDAYQTGADWARERGIIIADTKFELGWIDGELAICDEVLTPDSSRFWPAADWEPGSTPPSFDKQPRARLPRRGRRLGQDPAAAGAARRGGRGHRGPLPRGLRAHHRQDPRRVARRRLTPPVDRRRFAGAVVDCGMRFDVQVETSPRAGIADPQGATIERSLPALGFDGVHGRAGRQVHPVRRRGRQRGRGPARVDDMCAGSSPTR